MARPHWTILLLALLFSACASSGAGAGSGGPLVPVQVENDLTNRGDVTIRVVASTGASSLLGGLAPGRARIFQYRAEVISGNYRLTARTGDGREIESRLFTLFPGAGVTWQLQRNVLQVVNAEIITDPGP